ncbi:MAG: hypothetical protein O2923_11445 [Verrucomicrobia bacterium]|nr:hypothetical protein [Verrucomicrobiota bacterium]MDA1086945.1 hypothetical protein [Verrucomicrobiota bacterium]
MGFGLDGIPLTRRLQIIAAASFVFASGMPAEADRLIITTDGRSILAATAKQAGDAIVYVERASGEEKQLPVLNLTAVIPIARRGKTYTEAEVRKYVSRIESAQKRHPRLVKQLKPLREEWMQRLEPPPELDGEIAGILKEFRAVEPEYGNFKRTMSALGMLALKDSTGSFDAKIEKARAGLSGDYFQILANQCADWSAKDALSVDEFIRYRSIIQLARGVDKAGAKKLAQESDPLRKRVLEHQRGLALGRFSGAPGLDRYLHGLGLLGRLEKEIAADASESGPVEKARGQLRAAYKNVEPKRWFTEDGYPMAKEDFGLSKEMRRFGELVTFNDIEVDRECYIISKAKVHAVRYRHPTRLSFRLIFNQLHEDADYGVVVRLFEQSGHHEHVLPLKGMLVTDGRADVTVTEDFSEVPQAFEPALNERTGKRYFYAYIAYRRVGKDGAPEWRAISPSRGWFLNM